MNHFKAVMAVLACAAVPASASTVVTTFTGQVGSVSQTGADTYFGPSGVHVGSTYTLSYTSNDAAPAQVLTPDSYSTRLNGGVKAVLTINTISKQVGGTNEAFTIAVNDKPNTLGNPTDIFDVASRDFNYVPGVVYKDYSARTIISSYLQNFLSSSDFRSDFTFTPDGPDSVYNYVYFNDFDYATNTGQSLYLNLNLGSVQSIVTATGGPVGGVPEPMSWTLMLSGFGLAGIAARRRQERPWTANAAG